MRIDNPILGAPVSGDFTVGTFTWPTFNQNTTGSAGSVANALTIGTGLSGTSYNGSSAVTIAINSTVALRTDTHYIGTTAVTLNRVSANLALTGISSITLPGATSGTVQLLPTAISGTTTLTLPATTGTLALTSQIPTVNDGSLTLQIGVAGPTNTSVTVGTGTGFTANDVTNTTYDIRVGPALSALSSFMTTATAGFIRRSGQDTYEIDTTVYTTNVGTVTSVSGTGTVSGLTLTGTVTTSGNLTLGGTLTVTPSNFASQVANTVLAAPNGSAGVPTFRALASTDIPSLDASKITTGVFDAARLPSYVDDVLEYANLAAFPVTGEVGKIYIALDTNKTYRWSGTVYVYITSGAVDSVGGYTGVVSATNLLDSIKTVDGAASGLDADLLDGNHASAFYLATNPSGYTTNTGTVTSVSMTVPTGLSITGSPITTSGTLALSLTAGYSIPTTASQTNWDTAYTDRNKWDGGSTGLVAATGRTSLGGTTVGQNMFTLVNPTAVTFPRFNADNTVSALDAATFRTAIGAGTSSTVGTVTSVTAGNGMTQTGTSTVNPTLNIVSHAGTAGSIGTINVGADAIGVNLGTTSTTAYPGNNPSGFTTNTGTVTSVGNGNGMNFTTFTTTGTVTLGTPSTCTNASTNAVTASSHTHAITGFLTAEADTLATVTGRGSTTSTSITADSAEFTGLGTNGDPGTDDLYVGGYGIQGSRVSPVYLHNHSTGGIRISCNASLGTANGILVEANQTTVTGLLSATTKSFLIKHPTKEGMKLQYGSLESPYHGVRLTGEGEVIDGHCVIHLPNYIHGLCKQEGSQVQITNIRHGKVLWVDSIDVENDCFVVGMNRGMFDKKEYKFYWSFTAVRKDVADIVVEFEG